MDTLDYIHDAITEQAIACDIFRPDDSAAVYDDSLVDTGSSVEIAISDPSSTSVVQTEGVGEDISLVGHVVPQTDQNGQLTEVLHIGDQLVPQSAPEKAYNVRTKDGVPNELDPEIWQLGLERSNESE
jgi:hypothetical protein